VWLCADGPDKKPSAQEAAVGTLNQSRSEWSKGVDFSIPLQRTGKFPSIGKSLGANMVNENQGLQYHIFFDYIYF
jgi:hypothetical protein